jgi:prepilin-type N-terminal cleavage/methylation domain-containing protein
MFRRVQNKKQYFNLGFTLVELLVVIAIIGILSSVAVVNLNSAREKARASAVLASFVELNSAVRLCMDDEKPIKCTSADSPDGDCGQVTSELAPGTIICAGSSNAWPDLASKYSPWEYNSNFIFDTEDQTYTIGAAMIGASGSVTCTELGCVSGAVVSATCGNGIREGAELCDSNLAGTCTVNPSYYELGYVGTGACESGGGFAGCNITCDACVLGLACRAGGPS